MHTCHLGVMGSGQLQQQQQHHTFTPAHLPTLTPAHLHTLQSDTIEPMGNPVDRHMMLILQDNAVPLLRALQQSLEPKGAPASAAALEAVAVISVACSHLERILRDSPFQRAADRSSTGAPVDLEP